MSNYGHVRLVLHHFRMKVMIAAIGVTAASFRYGACNTSCVRLMMCDHCRVSWLGLNCPGAYRKLVAYPKNLSWNFRSLAPHHSSPCQQTTPPVPSATSACTPGPQLPATTLAAGKSAEELDLELNFDLDTSSYATMFVREIAKHIY